MTFVLHASALVLAVRSVEAAQWAPTPPLWLVAVLAALSAAFLARSLRRLWPQILIGLFLGALVVYFSGVAQVSSEGLGAKFADFNSRIAGWWGAVLGQDASTDVLPFSVILTSVTWLASFLTTWVLFRHKWVWLAVLPVGGGMLINLTHLPPGKSIYFVFYLLFVLLLIAQMGLMRWRSALDEQKVEYPSMLPRLYFGFACGVTAVIVLVVALMPLGDKPSRPLRPISRAIDHQVNQWQADFQRVFGGVRSQRSASLRLFGSVLPLVRPIPQEKDPIALAYAPLFWRVRSYDTYTSKAWKATDTELKAMPDVSAATQAIEDPTFFEDFSLQEALNVNIIYEVRLYADTPFYLTTGDAVYIDLPAQIQVPKAPTYHLDLSNPASLEKLPADVKDWAGSLDLSKGGANPLALSLQGLNTSDIRITRVVIQDEKGHQKATTIDPNDAFYGGAVQKALDVSGIVKSVDVMPTGPSKDSVALKRESRLPRYVVYGNIPTASEEALRLASAQYPDWIKGRYLQLPSSLPQRVKDMAADLAKNADNPYDKAVAIETALRNFKYRARQLQLPFDADGVDYFIFQAREGPSDYFASSMVVMLRSMGIPARFAFGYGPGKEDKQLEGYIIRDYDNHSWPEVYFPSFGWIEFEPTPIYPQRLRGSEPLAFGQGGLGDQLGGGAQTTPQGGQQDVQQDPNQKQDELPGDEGGRLPGGFGPRPFPLRAFGAPLGLGGSVFWLLLGALILLVAAYWGRRIFRLVDIEHAYRQLVRLAGFLGAGPKPSDTPLEFCAALASRVPSAQADILFIGETFIKTRYGKQNLTLREQMELRRGWRRLRRALMAAGLNGGSLSPR